MPKSKVQISASILSADFGGLNKEIASVEKLVDSLHVDVMDGHFVPNLTFGAPVVSCIKTKLPMNCHLMVSNPEELVESFAKAGASAITVHQEATQNLSRLVEQIRALGCRVGVSINPGTPVWTLEEVLDELDLVLVMSVNPGFGGQEFIRSALEKISVLKEMRPDLTVEVDGGVNANTAPEIVAAGADVLVSGSYIFKAKNRAAAINKLRL